MAILCKGTDISAPIGVKFCMMVHICPGRVFSLLWGGTIRGPQNPNCSPLKIECLENGKLQRYMSITA